MHAEYEIYDEYQFALEGKSATIIGCASNANCERRVKARSEFHVQCKYFLSHDFMHYSLPEMHRAGAFEQFLSRTLMHYAGTLDYICVH